jgi:hypothetical protein
VKSTSRQRSAISSPLRRPVNAAVRKIAASCSLAAARTSAHTSSGLKTSMSGGAARESFDLGGRVRRQPVDLLRTAEDAVQLDEQLVLRPRVRR